MMGYKESIAQELSLGDPLFQRIHNLRPLIPNSYLSPPNHNHLLHHHHDFGNNNNNKNKGVIIEECNKEGMNAQAQAQHQVMVSSRWNPTPEQLTALEELYRCGTRTPSAEQIQHITAQLRRYGKIEGKNVFYWFQNHKARERQKRRRQLQPHLTSSTINTTTHANHVLDKGFEEEEKNGKRALFITNNNKESDSEAPILQQSAAAAAVTAAGPRKSENSSNSLQCLFQFHQQFQPNYNPNNSSSSSSYPTNNNKHLFLSDQLGNATCSPPHLHLFSLSSSAAVEGSCRGDGVVVPTLQLFPVAKPGGGGGGDGEDCELLKKDGEVIGLFLSSSKEEKNDSNEFVPYYHFL